MASARVGGSWTGNPVVRRRQIEKNRVRLRRANRRIVRFADRSSPPHAAAARGAGRPAGKKDSKGHPKRTVPAGGDPPNDPGRGPPTTRERDRDSCSPRHKIGVIDRPAGRKKPLCVLWGRSSLRW